MNCRKARGGFSPLIYLIVTDLWALARKLVIANQVRLAGESEKIRSSMDLFAFLTRSMHLGAVDF